MTEATAGADETLLTVFLKHRQSMNLAARWAYFAHPRRRQGEA